MRKTVCGIVLMLLLTSMLSSACNIQSVKAEVELAKSLSPMFLWGVSGVFVAGRSEIGDEPEPALTFADGTGGAFVIWGYDKTPAGGGLVRLDYYIQRIDSVGGIRWGDGGVLLGADVNSLSTPLIICDRIVTWTDYRNGRKIFAQKLDSDGQFLWTEDVVVMPTGGDHDEITTDGNGGAIIMGTTGYPDSLVEIQRVDNNGNIKWTPSGIDIVNPNLMTSPYDWAYGPYFMISDGEGGVFIAWADMRNNGTLRGIYIQHVNIDGEILWIDNGVPVVATSNVSISLRLVGIAKDDTAGVIVSWLEGSKLYSQRLNMDGVTTWDNSVLIGENVYNPRIVSTAGGAMIVWQMSPNKIYAQKINSNGELQWRNETLISSSGYHANLVPDSFGGAIVAWSISQYPYSIYCQKLNADGETQWGNEGIMVSQRGGGFDTMASDYFNGVLVTWKEYREGDYGIYAQRISDVIPNFLIMASPNSLVVQQGNSDTSAITITSISGFTQTVQLSISGAPPGVTATLSPEQVTPPPDGSTTSTLTVSVDTTATPRSYTLTVTGTNGTLTHSIDISLQATQVGEWSFAIITDIHIGWGYSDYGDPGYDDANLETAQNYWLTERLKSVVERIVQTKNEKNVKFVVVLGDIADTAEKSEFLKAREILSILNDPNGDGDITDGIPYIPVIGNHDIWSYTMKQGIDPDERHEANVATAISKGYYNPDALETDSSRRPFGKTKRVKPTVT